MAEAGARVLILEREARFRDRVRGEAMHPWAVVEAMRAGVAGSLMQGRAQPIRWKNIYVRARLASRRDLPATTASPVGGLDVHHPAMQQVLLEAAMTAGADVRRPADVVAVVPGSGSRCSASRNASSSPACSTEGSTCRTTRRRW
jgi:2-polyprenyl-6-methoxyphenol hydroxylase-like FAD-dependent oxidoreductase